jgi:patatin-like phospholipase/acyl hydrolase
MVLNVLSVDSGGVRGVVPTILLSNVEKEFNVNLHDYFDAFAGTSVGSLLAAYLACGGRATTMRNLMSRASFLADIFDRTLLNKMFGWIPGSSFVLPQYSGRGRMEIINKHLPPLTFSQLDRALLIPTYNITRLSTFFANNIEPLPVDISVREAVAASSAAPGYFPAVQMHFADCPGTIPDYYLVEGMSWSRSGDFFVDGGVGTPSPSLTAYNMLRRQYPDEKIRVFSIGTGYQQRPIDPYINTIFGWMTRGLQNSVISAPVQNCNSNMSMMDAELLRVDIPLTANMSGRGDDHSRDEMVSLIKIANQAYTRQHDDIAAFFKG